MTTNEKPGFTPGPWKAVRGYSYWEVSPAERKDWEPFTVADCCPSCPGDPDGGLQEANAHLIAAAPDLYEALIATKGYSDSSDFLKQLLEYAKDELDDRRSEWGDGDCEIQEQWILRIERAIALRDAALAKARGEA